MIWKAIPDFDNRYEVSDEGKVRDYFYRRKHRAVPVELSLSYDRDGYLTVMLVRDGKQRTYFVHRLVLTSFVGECPLGHQGGHLNGVRDDNRLVNLKWVTPAENARHRFEHGTDFRGEKSPVAKLTNAQVKEIRQRYARGKISQVKLANEYSVGQATISRIIRKENFKEDG